MATTQRPSGVASRPDVRKHARGLKPDQVLVGAETAELARLMKEHGTGRGRIGCNRVYIRSWLEPHSTIPITLLRPIAEIDEFKGAWRALGTSAPERLSALRRIATIESIGSSTRIGGSKVSDRDVERLLASPEIKSFTTRDEQEVAGYAEAMELIFRAWKTLPSRKTTSSKAATVTSSCIATMTLGTVATTRHP
jgi:hypothetical protein